MSSNLVIVAIPDQDDRVWKISSEKIPHLTLLFLGDADQVSNLDQIMLFVEHAASTSLKRFYLPVDHRGELGDDKADVLFFKKGRYDFAAVRDFRSLLLKDTNIKTAYDSTRQFETPKTTGQAGQPWIPHLTLGYPTSPAKKLPEGDFPNFYDVSFNRIAVWTGDFEGPEFLLKDYWDEFDETAIPMDVAMSDLQHYGVKGQKWGVRKVEGGGEDAHIRVNKKTGQASLSTESTLAIVVPAVVFPPLVPLAFLSKRVRAEVKAARAVNQGVRADKKQAKELGKEEEKFTKHAQQASNFVAIHNGAGPRISRDIDSINKKYSDTDLTKDPAKRKQYDGEVLKSTQDAYKASANSLTNKSATMHLDVSFHGADQMDVKIEARKGAPTPMEEPVKHAASDDTVTFSAKIKRVPTGHIIGFEFDDFETASAEHTAELGAEFLAHLSEEPWSNFTKADYTLEQWHTACLIHTHDGDPTSKSECKLPVKTPDGALNRNGVHAAAAALAGARGGLKGVSDDQKKKAAGALRRYYTQLDEDPPESLAQSAVDLGSEFILEHFGVKGMHWGQRKAPPTAVSTSSTSVVPHGTKRKTKIQVEGGENHPAHDDAIRVAEAKAKLKKSGTSALSNQELREMANRLQLENQVALLTSSKGKQFVSREFETTSKQLIKRGTKQGAKRYGPTVVKKAGKTAATAATIAVL